MKVFTKPKEVEAWQIRREDVPEFVKTALKQKQIKQINFYLESLDEGYLLEGFAIGRGDYWEEFRLGDYLIRDSYGIIKGCPLKAFEKSYVLQPSGIALGFGTGEVGRSSMKLQFSNEWLNLKFYITADRGTTMCSIFSPEMGARSELGYIEDANEEHSALTQLDYSDIELFNQQIKPILRDFFSEAYPNEDFHESQLDGFSLTGLAIDLD